MAELERDTLDLEEGLERDHFIWSCLVDHCLCYLLSKDADSMTVSLGGGEGV